MKEFLAWRDTWNTGIGEIDAQHRAMAQQLNAIAVSLTCGHASTTTLAELLEELLQLTRAHFDYEESLMRAANYSGYAAHKSEHDMLKGELKAFIERVEHHQLTCNIDMLRSLKQWFVGHIVLADKDYAHVMLAQDRDAPANTGGN